jgi:hypothetical protein
MLLIETGEALLLEEDVDEVALIAQAVAARLGVDTTIPTVERFEGRTLTANEYLTETQMRQVQALLSLLTKRGRT